MRCLVCQGQSVGDSNSEFAQTIKLVVKDQIKDGKTEEEIYEFLIEKYGDWIVYKPPLNKFNFIIMDYSIFGFFGGGFNIFLIIKKRINHSQKAIYTYLLFNSIFF